MKRIMLTCIILLTATLTFTGCPTYQIALGSWIFDSPNFFYPAGFTLNANGTAANFITDPNAQPWQGTWEWESDGRTLTLFDSSAADGYVFEGRLQSATAASGILRHADQTQSVAEWDALHVSP
jgi:hypothetical protein